MLEKFIGDVKGIFNIITLIDLVLAIICILMGLVFFTSPNMSNLLVSIFIGIIFISDGVVSIVSYFKRGDISLYNYNLIYGILLILTGILTMILGNIITIMFGVYFIVSGIQKGSYGLLLKKFKESSWLIMFVIGILYLILGIVSFFTSNGEAVKVVGICLLGYGLINLIDTILLRKRSKFFLA